jgi:hypothetical protein
MIEIKLFTTAVILNLTNRLILEEFVFAITELKKLINRHLLNIYLVLLHGLRI